MLKVITFIAYVTFSVYPYFQLKTESHFNLVPFHRDPASSALEKKHTTLEVIGFYCLNAAPTLLMKHTTGTIERNSILVVRFVPNEKIERFIILQ